MTDIVETVKEATKSVAEMKSEFAQRIEYLERAEAKAKGFRPYGGGVSGEDWQSADMAEFLRKNALPLECKDLSITNDGQGVTVRSDWSSRIFKLVRESSPMRQIANVMNTSSNELSVLVDRAEPQSDWISETAARDETAASFLTRHAIPVSEHYALPVATQHLIEDSEIDVENWLQGKVASRFARQESLAFILGDGNGKPRGILTYATVPDDDFAWGADPNLYQIGAVYSGVNAALPASDQDAIDLLGDLVDALKAEYLPGASFLMTRKMRNAIRKLKDDDGRFYYQPSLADGLPDRLMGYPVRLAEDMGDLEADGVGILFGNFAEAYTIADRVGVSIIRDQVTRPGFVRWYVRRRLGGALTNPEAVKALVLGSAPE